MREFRRWCRITQAQKATGASLPWFIKDDFDAFLACAILAHCFLRLRLRCRDGGHDKLLAFSFKRRAFCPHAVRNAVTLIQRFGSAANRDILPFTKNALPAARRRVPAH